MSAAFNPTAHHGAAELSLRDNGRWFVSVSSQRGSFCARWFDDHASAFAFAAQWCAPAHAAPIQQQLI